jgi:hypothetical protein
MSETIQEALKDLNVQKSLGTSGLLAMTLEGCHQESKRIGESLMKSEYIVGWNDGYAAGYAKGVEEIRLEMQRLIGVFDSKEYLPGKETLREQDFEARQKERGK